MQIEDKAKQLNLWRTAFRAERPELNRRDLVGGFRVKPHQIGFVDDGKHLVIRRSGGDEGDK